MASKKMNEKVDLGFLGEFEDWELQSRQFPSKVGGKPAWLDLKNLPPPSQVSCSSCSTPLTFLLQVYCPDNDVSSAFHRTLFLFICRSPSCWSTGHSQSVIVLRSQLPRENSFYPFQPPLDSPDWGADIVVEKHCTVCPACGGKANKMCGRCKGVSYCSELHQRADWKAGHKGECKDGGVSVDLNRVGGDLLKQKGLDVEGEPEEDEETDEAEEMKKYEDMVEKGEAGCVEDTEELEKAEEDQVEDKVFSKWSQRVKRAPGQVIRFDRGGQPLWCSKAKLGTFVPNCETCGAERSFEFQVMPQLLGQMGLGLEVEDGPDWGSVYVFTCTGSCQVTGYVTEFALVNQFDNINLPGS